MIHISKRYLYYSKTLIVPSVACQSRSYIPKHFGKPLNELLQNFLNKLYILIFLCFVAVCVEEQKDTDHTLD